MSIDVTHFVIFYERSQTLNDIWMIQRLQDECNSHIMAMNTMYCTMIKHQCMQTYIYHNIKLIYPPTNPKNNEISKLS